MPKIEHDFGDIAQRIRRVALAYRWRMIGTACGVAVATAVVVQFLPKSYRSEAALASVQQQVS